MSDPTEVRVINSQELANVCAGNRLWTYTSAELAPDNRVILLSPKTAVLYLT